MGLDEQKHERFSPSQAERNTLCPGSSSLIATKPKRESSPEAIEGTTAHTVLEAGILNQCKNATEAIDNSIHCIEDFDIMFKAAINDALDYVFTVVEELNAKYGDAVVFVEHRVNPPLHAAPGQGSGKVDIVIYSAIGRVVFIIDYKHGVGIPKAIEGNKQVLQYGAGFLFEEEALVNPADIDEVNLVIIQPRSFHPDGQIKELQVTPAVVYDYLFEMEAYVEAALDPEASLVPGIAQCVFCDANTTCPALERSCLQALHPEFFTHWDVTKAKMPDPRSLTAEHLGQLLASMPLINLWIRRVERHAYELALQGREVVGKKLVEANPKRGWYGEENDIAVRLAAQIDCPPEDIFRKSLRTITDLEQEIKRAFKSRVGRGRKKQAAEEAAHVFAFFTLKESSGTLTLVDLDDSRPAVNKALQHFGGVEGLVQPPTKEGT